MSSPPPAQAVLAVVAPEISATAAVVVIVVAAASWGLMFGPDRTRLGGFWLRAAIAASTVALTAGVVLRDRLGALLEVRAGDVALGIAGAAVLYGVFFAGDRLVRWLFPTWSLQIDDLYAMQSALRPPTWMPAVTVLAGVAEELAWRGVVQSRLGIVVALVGYSLVHIWERKAILLLAALTGGIGWGVLFALTDGRLVAPLLSHVLWDVAIVLVWPVRGRRPFPRPAGPPSPLADAPLAAGAG